MKTTLIQTVSAPATPWAAASLFANNQRVGHQMPMRKHDAEVSRTRASLIARLKDWQDHSSWQQFFNTYWKLIYSVARRAGLTDDEAQDVVQETMASVARHMPNFQYDPALGSFKSWLMIKTRWCIIEQLRKRPPQGALPRVAEDTPTGTATVEKIVDPASQDLESLWELEWQQTLLDAALAKVRRSLDPQKYQIFDCYANREWPPQKVAATFGVSIEQVYLTKHRVTELLKQEVQRLEREGI